MKQIYKKGMKRNRNWWSPDDAKRAIQSPFILEARHTVGQLKLGIKLMYSQFLPSQFISLFSTLNSPCTTAFEISIKTKPHSSPICNSRTERSKGKRLHAKLLIHWSWDAPNLLYEDMIYFGLKWQVTYLFALRLICFYICPSTKGNR